MRGSVMTSNCARMAARVSAFFCALLRASDVRIPMRGCAPCVLCVICVLCDESVELSASVSLSLCV